MRDLIIVGTGVHGGEMAEIVERVNRAGPTPTWNLLGHLAKDEAAAAKAGPTFNGYPVLGPVAQLDRFPGARLVPDNEFPRSIPLPVDRLISLIDPSAFVSRTATIGQGSVIYPHCYVGLRACLGDFVFALSSVTINHDDVIGDRVVLASGACLAGGVSVEADCYLGQACTIRQHLRIGKGSLIGTGAVVVKDVPDNSVMVGNPARRLRQHKRPAASAAESS